jgi:hypothetical protein
MPPPARTHLPLRQDLTTTTADPKTLTQQNGTVFDENDPSESVVHPELQRLPSLSLRGTFLLAYSILVKINTCIGWDELLKHRSLVFVMEDEYRIHRSIVEESQKGEEEELEDDMEAIDLGDSPKPQRAVSRNNALQIDKLVSDAQKSQPNTTAAKPVITPVSYFLIPETPFSTSQHFI